MNLTDPVKWTDVAQLVATVIGFVLVIVQLRRLRSATEGDTHADLYGQYMEVGKLFLSKPHLRPYFYESAAIDVAAPDGARTSQEVAVMCELVTSLLEHAALQEPNLPGDSWEECWKAYTYERFDCSAVLREWWRANESMYAARFRKVVNSRLETRNCWSRAASHSGGAEGQRIRGAAASTARTWSDVGALPSTV